MVVSVAALQRRVVSAQSHRICAIIVRLKRINRRNQPRIGGDFFNLCNLITHADEVFSDIEHAGKGNNPFFGDNVEEEPEGLSLLLIDAGEDYTLRNPRFKGLLA